VVQKVFNCYTGKSSDAGVLQTDHQSFEFNGESNLDLEYGMVFVDHTRVLLLQTGDLVEGLDFK